MARRNELNRRCRGPQRRENPAAPSLLRGDMDALPMDEETGLEFASTVFGPDACLRPRHPHRDASRRCPLSGCSLGRFAGRAAVHVPAGRGGISRRPLHARRGALLDPLPEAAFALHIMPNAPHGTIGSRAGTLLASADMLEIAVEGRGGHASMPHDARDPVPVACEIVLALQTMVTRRFNAARSDDCHNHAGGSRERS